MSVTCDNKQQQTLQMKRCCRRLEPRDWQGFECITDTYDNVNRDEISCRVLNNDAIRLAAPKIKTPEQPIRKLSLDGKQSRIPPVEQLPKIQLRKYNHNKQTTSPNKYSESRKKQAAARVYPQIKILNNMCQSVGLGTLIYKSSFSSTSDRLMTHLKDANLSQQANKEMHIRDLSFSSKFQCGNLCCVYKVADNQYDLHMRVDTNTYGHRQWYYFNIKNKRTGIIKLNISQFMKPFSLYQRGMKPYVLSKKAYQQDPQNGWKQQGDKVRYKPAESDSKKKSWYLTFQYNFLHENDQVFFAACPPYSYSSLIKQLNNLAGISKCRFEIDTNAKSLCGLDIPLVTISHPDSANNQADSQSSKHFIVILARTHPGESASSWVISGFLKHFTSAEFDLNTCPKNLVIKIIPMMNVDGVFLGNYRTGVIGKDFNRKFNSGKEALFPEIEMVRRLVRQLKKEGRVCCFIDLHGHSIQKNSFIFGARRNQLQQCNNSKYYFKVVTKLPEQLAKVSQYFKLSSCRFRVQTDMKQTARVFFQQQENIISYTIENSLGLYTASDGRTYPMEVKDWERFGVSLAECLIKLSPYEDYAFMDKTQLKNSIKLQSKNICLPLENVISPYEKWGKIIQERFKSFSKRTPAAKLDEQFQSSDAQQTKQASASPYSNNRFVRRFKSTCKPRNMEIQQQSYRADKTERVLNVRDFLKEADKMTQEYESINVRKYSEPAEETQIKRDHANRSVEDTMKDGLKKKLLSVQLRNPKPSIQTLVDLENLSSKSNSQINDSDAQSEDIPDNLWQALINEVIEVVDKSSQQKDLLKLQLRKQEQVAEEKEIINQSAKLVNKQVKKRPQMVPPNGFREMRFTLSKLYPKQKQETLERVAQLYSIDTKTREKMTKTEPSLAVTEKYLSEHLSMFNGGKLIQPMIVMPNRRGIFNQRRILQRIKRSINTEVPPLAKYFKKYI